MGCLIAICSVFVPRVTLFVILLATDWFSRAYETVIWPLLGFIFMPYTTLVYMGATLNGGFGGGWTLLMIFAVIGDMADWIVIRNKRAS